MANLYDPHPLMINSGTFWRCTHVTTGYDVATITIDTDGVITTKQQGYWAGCKPCALANPMAFYRWYFKDITVADIYDALHKTVTASLRDCISTHGPITKERIGSAAKRILCRALKR